MSHCHIAFFIRGGAPDDGHIDGKGFVIEILFPLELDELHQFLFGDLRYATSLQAGVHIRPEADLGDHAHFPAGHLPRRGAWPI